MNPAIVIPTYWDSDDSPRDLHERGSYDHVTPVGRPMPELEGCLSSLEAVRGVTRVVVLVVAPPSVRQAARARVDGICRTHPRLNPLVVGADEAQLVSAAVGRVVPDMDGETISLRGYGAIRNMGLLVACVLGHDVVVFMDDDEVAQGPDFLVDAVYGLGRRSSDNTPIQAKTGYFLDRDSSPYASGRVPWHDRRWSKHDGFNQWMRRALSDETPRIVRSNVCCGGCLALHASAFTLVPFDPWITRGEDLDYLLDLRLAGMDLWFDSAWSVRHLPPPTRRAPARFLQDAYRWTYEAAKLERANRRMDVRRLSPSSLDPYPGPWLGRDVSSRIATTALLRAVGCPERRDYLWVLRHGLREAEAYATASAERYWPFVARWQQVAAELWDDSFLARRLVSRGTPKAPAPAREKSWMELTGSIGGPL